MSKTTQAGLQNSFVTDISLTTSELLGARNILPEILAPVQDLRSSGTGNTVRVLRDPKGTLRDAQDLSGKTYDTPTQLFDEVTLDYFREVNFQFGSLDETIGTNQITIDRYPVSGATQIGNDIESNVMQDILDDPNIPAGNELGTVGVEVNEALFIELAKRMDIDNVPEANRVVILSPTHYAQALKNVTAFKSNDFIARGSVQTGKLPVELYGVRVYKSNLLPGNDNLASVTGTDTNQVSIGFWTGSILFTMAALPAPAVAGATLYAQESVDGYMVRARAWDDNNLNAKRLVMDALYGVKVVQNPTTTAVTNTTAGYPILGGIA